MGVAVVMEPEAAMPTPCGGRLDVFSAILEFQYLASRQN
jgi:hypothetical protein